VPSKHKEAPAFLRRGFFEGLKSFSDFEARTEKLTNTKEVGDAFEILVEAYLHLDPVLCVKEVWLVGDIPLKIRNGLNLPADSKGIDGVYEDTSGNLIPYQVKYRTDKDTLSYGEVSSFLGITEESLKDRVIFTNARNLAPDITKRKGLRSVRAAQFHDLTEDDFKRILGWLSDKKPEFKRWAPQPHQKEAIEKITAALKESDRTTAVMACGTGKTLVALWAAEAQAPKTVLVLVPSLALLSQTLPDWCKQTSWGNRFRYLCVCSDASVDRSAKEDEYALKQSDLEFPVTTDASQVKAFAAGNKTGVNVIFSTYQSAEVVAEGLKGQAIDLGIFDEAHKTTGPKDGLFAFGLSDKNLRIKKRLFLTATPRHYDLRKRDKDGDYRTVSMSDEAVYGKVSYRLSFSAAVAAGIIVPYKVIISVSLNKEVDNELLRRGSTLVRRNQIQAKWVANQIALKRAIEKTKASKIITFHSRVKLAEDFAGDGAQGFSEHCKGFEIFHVNGSQNAADRKALLDGFKAAPKGLITNARCLTEGVDVPAVDMVAFVDPRKSRIDIAQAAGRAMRLSRATNKKLGYIVVPLFIEQKKGETESEALKRSGFDEVAMVLGAMLENDDDLVDVIREMQEARGGTNKFNPKELHEKVQVIGPDINLDELTRSIDVKILERLGVSWDRFFGLLKRFYVRHGHCRVSPIYVEDDLCLGRWTIDQRHRRDRLTPPQLERLNSIGFSWDPRSDQWETGFSALLKFHKREGHSAVPQTHSENGFKLGLWVAVQRRERKHISTERVRRLDSLNFAWEVRPGLWEKAFAALLEFHRKQGHCRVPLNFKAGKISLGNWVGAQRQKKDQLTVDQIKRLDALGFSWDPHAEQWDKLFRLLKKYSEREGHCYVPHEFMEDGEKLGNWVGNLRQYKDRLSADKINQLVSLGFSWNSRIDKWQKSFDMLRKFHSRFGHCRVSRDIDSSYKSLARWVSVQRRNKSRLTFEQIGLLESLDFSWNPHAEQWEHALLALQDFHRREGHCRVPLNLKVGNITLGNWVGAQRQKKNQLTVDQIKRLDALGFSWDPHTEQWDKAFLTLEKFRKEVGHCRVPRNQIFEGLNLGKWVATQRRNAFKLSEERLSRLNSLGFAWKV
jgi:superfamily II DNA or RNA helicase